MPPMDTKDVDPADQLMRVFLYGKDKTKKTWWALRAAEANLNVILLDADGGSQIAKQIPDNLRGRIMRIDIQDTMDRAVAAKFTGLFLRDNKGLIWNEQSKEPTYNPPPQNSVLEIKPGLLSSNTVLVLDSWTALAASAAFSYGIEQNFDMTDASKTEWDGYGYEGRFLNFVLKQLKALPCHVIVIGHMTVYEKRSKDGKTIVSQTTQPISSSGPHAAKIGKHFNDVLFFQRISDVSFKINAGGSESQDGGSRNLEPRVYNWDDCPPKLILEKLGALPERYILQEAIKYWPPGTYAPVKAAVKSLVAPSLTAGVGNKSLLSLGQGVQDKVLSDATTISQDEKKPSIFSVKK